MSNKKDLTRIEDLGEFIHELSEDEELTSGEDFLSETSELPDLPQTEDDSESSFTSDFSSGEDLSFGTTEETPAFETSSDFTSNFSSESSSELTGAFNESTLEDSSNFDTSDFTSNFELDADALAEETPKEEKPLMPSLNLDSEPEPFFSEPVKEEAPVYTPSPEYKAPENFEDLKKFSESSSFTGMATEGNPSFSVLIKNVRFIEDVNDIVSLLKELGLLIDPEEQVKTRLMRGTLLVSRISEYAAIFLAHKLRRFDIDIQVGLSDEIHPPKHQEAPETGIVSKYNLFQNQGHHFHFDDPKLELSQIIVAATPSLEGHQVLRYMGVASEHKMLEGHIVEDETSEEVPRHYQELAQKLKAHALKAHANAVVGLNYQLTPIPSEFGMGGHKYRLTCTGNLVWVNKL